MDARELPWTRDPEVMGGELVFRGTRVLVASLFSMLEGGETLESFLEDFPSVPRERVSEALRLAGSLVERVSEALDTPAPKEPQLAA